MSEKFVTVEEVMSDLEVSRSTAYDHMRRAVRRERGARGILRVPRAVWVVYKQRNSDAPAVVEQPTAVSNAAPVSRGPARRTCKPSAPRDTSGVYFIQHDVDGPIKIGYAADGRPTRRRGHPGGPDRWG